MDAGETVPNAVAGTFLIDTGASITAVDPELLAGLNLPVISQTPIMTPSTGGVPHLADMFDVGFLISNDHGAPFIIPALPIISSSLRPQGIDGLIGRDILRRCTLTYIGSAGLYSLSY